MADNLTMAESSSFISQMIGASTIMSCVCFDPGVVVPEEQIRSQAASIAKTSQKLEKDIQQYLSILETVLSSGVVSGTTHDSLAAFVSAAKMLNGKVQAIGSSASQTANAFLDAVDSADGYLY